MKSVKYERLVRLLSNEDPSVEYSVLPVVVPSLPCGSAQLVDQLKQLADVVRVSVSTLLPRFACSVARSNYGMWAMRAKLEALAKSAAPRAAAPKAAAAASS